MSLVQVFCHDPLAFMQEQVVYVIVAKETSGLVDVTVDERPGSTVTNKVGAKVFRLRRAREGETPSIPAYFCPYEQKDLKSVMLGNDALWAFTPQMDGCTFGIGSQSAASRGTVRVCHVNTARAGSAVESEGLDVYRAQQRKMQHNLALSTVGRDGALIEPDTYMSEDDTPYALEATTFGMHPLGRAWTFHTLASA